MFVKASVGELPNKAWVGSTTPFPGSHYSIGVILLRARAGFVKIGIVLSEC